MEKREVETKFFTVSQNNSGGYFIENEDVGHYVIIEAENAKQAEEKLAEITEEYLEYCECCGERWFTWWDDEDGKGEPMIYTETVAEYRDMCGGNAIVYYYDGTKRKFELNGGNA